MRHINREDWLSRTIDMVETVMVRHGFVDDGLEKQPPSPSAADRERRQWIKLLASLFGKQKLRVQLAGKTIP
jgi:hypothetical protein